MTTGNNGGGSRFFGAIASRLGIVETEVFQEGIHQIREYRGLGLTFRRKTVASSPTLDGCVPELVSIQSGIPPTNGHTPEHSESLRILATHLETDEEKADQVEAEISEFLPPTAQSPLEADGETQLLAFAAHAGSASANVAASANGTLETLNAETLNAGTGHAPTGNGAAVQEPFPEADTEKPAESGETPAEQDAELPASGRHPILAGKTVAVIGFSGDDAALLGSALAAQYCSFLILSHAEAEFKKGSTTGCDLLMMQARPEWGEPGVLYPGSALKTKRPALIMGGRDALSAVALWTHGGPREFVPAPWVAEDSIWRAATLLVRMEASKTRRGKKTGRKLVIIGDADTASSTLLHAVLAQEGIACHVAENGVTALALAKSKQADAVMVDVSLPGLDGFQVLAELKRDPAMSNIVTILLTARQAEADVLRGFGLGADDYITKPFSPMEVVARLKRFLLRKP